mmetsp:Transcript_20598/g.34335  ORF Transcript_20598/g.34335 Transcript_20598/m.34335 type:complete len:93 (+) Transcript_20598:333-611(+)
MCIAMTQENVKLSPAICGLFEGRSRFARLGLFVHITASFMQPGIDARVVLEIFNASPAHVHLWPGVRICQMIFLRMNGQAQYQGKFQGQSLV